MNNSESLGSGLIMERLTSLQSVLDLCPFILCFSVLTHRENLHYFLINAFLIFGLMPLAG